MMHDEMTTAASPGRPELPFLRHLTGTLAAAVLTMVGLLALVDALPAAAQTVRGTLVEHPSGAPLPRGAVFLLDSAGVVVDSTRSTAAGAFALRAPAAGGYTLYFSHPGYASVPSDRIQLAPGDTVEHRFSVPLISGAAIRRMSEVLDLETRLQGNLTELCGEPLRSWEAGIVVGVVRQRSGGRPLAEAVVLVEAPALDGGHTFRRAAITSANGVYVICNVPAGSATMRTELAGFRTDDGPVEVRAGTVAWYDVTLRAR